MTISNKTLALFMLAAVVVSLGGTILNLNQLTTISTTGLATDTGTVNIDIAATVSITTEDSNAINFGQCTPLSGEPALVNSEGTAGNQSICDGINAPVDSVPIAVRNNGNIDALVVVRTNATGAAQGGQFLNSDSASSSVAIRTVDEGFGSFQGGCSGTVLSSYSIFNATGVAGDKTACSVLQFGGTQNSILAHIQLNIPFDAPQGADGFTVTFEGSQA